MTQKSFRTHGVSLQGGKVSVLELLKRCNEKDLEAKVSMVCNRPSPCKTIKHMKKQMAQF